MTKRRWLIIAVVIVVVVVGAVGLRMFFRLRAYEQKISNTQFSGIAPSQVADGVYRGEYDAVFIAARVEVAVKGGKLTDVKLLEYRHGRGEAALVIPDEMLRRQSLDVDVITGATNSCVVIRKAAELALESAPRSKQ